SIEIDAPLLDLKSDQGFIHVADDLVGDQSFLIQGLLFVYSRFGAFALVPIVNWQSDAYAKRVSAAAFGHLIYAHPQTHVRNSLRVLQVDQGVGGALGQFRGFQVGSRRQRFVAQVSEGEIVCLWIEAPGSVDV